jgi:hypothetical protein
MRAVKPHTYLAYFAYFYSTVPDKTSFREIQQTEYVFTIQITLLAGVKNPILENYPRNIIYFPLSITTYFHYCLLL